MASEHYQRAKEIFYQVCEMDPVERRPFLDSACDGDAALRRDIDRLLLVDENCRFLQQPALGEDHLLHRAVAAMAQDHGSGALPQSIGRYRIIQLIGEGGMGSVYEAQQDSPHRLVALKVIRAAFPSKHMVRRFEREIEILGRLHHPNIAQIYEADVAEVPGVGGAITRLPYYAMEFINGLPLIEHANQQALTDRQRLELLATVCDAVHFGHTHGVMHRDLKPSNILVDASSGGAIGEPKIIDFGVARATNLDPRNTRNTLATLNTHSGMLIGTLAYMSPEQVSGDGGEGDGGSANESNGGSVDGRSDVYALGVIGFEFLGGRLPYDLTGRSVPEAARIIRDEDPSSLSSISRVYRGDVETIIRRAMAKEPARRYQTAAEMAADIRRFLHDEPIMARRPTLRYRLAKFARRHKELVAGLALVMLVLIAGIVATTAGWMHAIESERTALRDATMAKKTSAVLQDLLAYAKPGMEGGGRDVRVVEMLNASSQNLSEELEEFPEVEAGIRRTLGETYFNLGYYKEAEANLRKALELTQAVAPGPSETALAIQERLAKVLLSSHVAARQEEGRVMARAAFQEARALLGPAHRVTQVVHLTLCNAILSESWNSPEIEPVTRDLINVLESLPEDQRAISMPAVMWRLAIALLGQGRMAEVDQIKNEALGLKATAVQGKVDHDAEVTRSFALGWIAHAFGRMDECERMFRRVIELRRRHLGDHHPDTLWMQNEFATVLARLGKLEEALAMRRENFEHYKQLDTDNAWHSNPNWHLHMYIAALLDRLGRTDESRSEFLKGIAVGRQLFGDKHFQTQEVWRNGTMRVGLRVQQSWTSEALRTQVRQVVENLLLANPSANFDLDEIDWAALQWSIESCDASPDAGGFDSNVPNVRNGGLKELWNAGDPEPGLHRVALTLKRPGSGPLTASEWMLVAPWKTQLFFANKTYALDRWEAVLRDPPAESLDLPSVALAGWWGPGEGFGPTHADYSFGVAATATVSWPAGRYRLLIDADDCVRAFVDDQLVIERWGKDHGFAVENALIQSDGGPHTIRVEYWQNGGDSRLWIRAEPLLDSININPPDTASNR